MASDSDSSLHSIFSQIARDERWKTRKEASQKKTKEVRDKKKDVTILSDDEEENEDILSRRAHTPDSTRPSYLQTKPQVSYHTNRERPLTLSLSTSSKQVIQRRSSSPIPTRISKRKHSSNSDQLLDYDEDLHISQAKKRSKNSKLSMAEAMAEESRLNHLRVTEQAKIDKEQAKEDRDERREQAEYDRRQRDQHHAMEMARQQAILNQGELNILQTRERVLRLQMNMQKQGGPTNLEEDLGDI